MSREKEGLISHTRPLSLKLKRQRARGSEIEDLRMTCQETWTVSRTNTAEWAQPKCKKEREKEGEKRGKKESHA